MTTRIPNVCRFAAVLVIASPMSALAAMPADIIPSYSQSLTDLAMRDPLGDPRRTLPENIEPLQPFTPGWFVFELDENGNAVCVFRENFADFDASEVGSIASVPSPGAGALAALALLSLRQRRRA